MKIKLLYLLILININCICLSQKNINGKIVDHFNNKISFVKITNKSKNFGVLSDSNGNFILNMNNTKIDTFYLFKIGFEKKTIIIDKISDSIIIEMSEKIKTLNVTNIKINKKKYHYTIDNSKRNSNINIAFYSGYEQVLFVPCDLTSNINNIEINISKENILIPPLRINFYSKDLLTGLPDLTINQDEIIISKIKEGKLKIDLDTLDIISPKNGFYIGIEVLLNNENNNGLYSNTSDFFIKGSKNIYDINKDPIYFRINSKKNLPLNYKYGDWHKSYTGSNIDMKINLISSQKFNKHDNSNVKIKKREIKKLFDNYPKKNILEYPQSSIKELFSSILSCVKNEKYNYLFSHLVIMPIEDKEIVLDKILNKENSTFFYDSIEKYNMVRFFENVYQQLNYCKIEELGDNNYNLFFSEKNILTVFEKNGLWYITPLIQTKITEKVKQDIFFYE